MIQSAKFGMVLASPDEPGITWHGAPAWCCPAGLLSRHLRYQESSPACCWPACWPACIHTYLPTMPLMLTMPTYQLQQAMVGMLAGSKGTSLVARKTDTWLVLDSWATSNWLPSPAIQLASLTSLLAAPGQLTGCPARHLAAPGWLEFLWPHVLSQALQPSALLYSTLLWPAILCSTIPKPAIL